MSLTRQRLTAIAGGLIIGACATPSALAQAQGAAAGASAMPEDHAALASARGDELIEQYCTKCHNFEDYAGGIDLEGLGPTNIDIAPEVGESVIKRLRAGMMPPVGEPRPDNETLQALAAALENRIDTTNGIVYGRPGLHRLNRNEYANAIRDLLAVQINPADFLPSDDVSNGFDNQAGTLTLSPALLEAYLSAAAKISQLAVGQSSGPSQTLYRVAEDANQNFRIEGLPFGTRGGIKFNHNFPVDGEYNLKTFAITLGNMGSDRPFGSVRGEKLQVLIDGELVHTFDWDEEFQIGRGFFFEPIDEEDVGQALPTLDVLVPITAGMHEVAITFVATNYAPGLDMNNDFERSTIETGGIPGFTWYPHVGSVRVEGPYNPTGASGSPSRVKVFSCYPESVSEEAACAEEIASQLAEVAFRGYSTDADVEKLMAFYELGRENADFDSGIGMVIQRVLADPKFIYRIEQEPENVAEGEAYAVSDLDLASRLSFFLWSSIPDQELLDLAKAGRLSDKEVLEQQVQRMLADSRSAAFTQNFAGQWLALRNLTAHAPVVDQFPDFDDLLRNSFRIETEMLFDYLVRENRPAMELVNADYTFVNERLAMHYGIPGVRGERFRKVDLDGDLAIRAGILGKGSVLTVASQPGRTSPVIRGFWALSSILGVEPPPPPPNVPALEAKTSDGAGNTRVPSMREQLEEHRDNPACQGCHRLMDPIGFALESFDAIGRFRTEENGIPIDPTGVMFDGTEIETAADLVGFFMQYEDSIVRNITQNLLTYALGRGMDYQDMPLVRKVKDEAADEGYRFQALINAVVQSEAFLMNQKVGGQAQAELGEAADVNVVARANGGI